MSSARQVTRQVARTSLCGPSLTPWASCSRLPSARSASALTAAKRHAHTSSLPSPFALGNLKPLQPAKTPKRLGRGSSSGRGGTATRGHKGQKSRAGNGKPTPGFEGGQTPLMRRYPKRGFTNIHAKEYVSVNLGRVQDWIDRGRLDTTQPITARELLESGCIHSFGDGVKLLGTGADRLQSPVHLVVSRASASAMDAVEAKGGSILCKYYTSNTLRALVKPHKYEGRLPPRDADPVSKRELVWYSNSAHRGYLANTRPQRRRSKPKAVKGDETSAEAALAEGEAAADTESRAA